MSTKTFLTSLILFSASQVALAGDDDSFTKLDVDQSGTISAEEAVGMEGLQETMAQYDLNGDRELDKNEFALFIETMESKTSS